MDILLVIGGLAVVIVGLVLYSMREKPSKNVGVSPVKPGNPERPENLQ